MVYGAAALVGMWRWSWMLALGWATHIAWDVPLHVDGAGAAYTPDWYPWFCVSFDLVLAAAVVTEQRTREMPRSRTGA